MCSLLLSTAKVDINRRSSFNHTPLLLAVCNGHLDVADILIMSGAEVPPAALFLGCAHGHIAVLERLLTVEGLHLGLVDDRGASCLILAAGGGYYHAGTERVSMGGSQVRD